MTRHVVGTCSEGSSIVWVFFHFRLVLPTLSMFSKLDSGYVLEESQAQQSRSAAAHISTH